jgi:dynein heavy chain 1
VASYQADILGNVTVSVAALREKQAAGYEGSAAHRVAKLRDVPPVAGHIAWALKIKAQLAHLEQQLESVMGAQWARVAGAEGEALSEQLHKLQRSLDPNTKYEAWLQACRGRLERTGADAVLALVDDPMASKRQQALQMQLQSKPPQSGKEGGGKAAAAPAPAAALASSLSLDVNFDDHTLELLKEVRNLAWLEFPIPATIREQAREAEELYPAAVALKGALRAYEEWLEQQTQQPSN